MSLIPSGLAKSGVAAFYTKEVGGSLCFDDNAGAYLSRTPSGTYADGRRKYAMSCWFKLGSAVSATKPLFAAGGVTWDMLYITSGNVIAFSQASETLSNFRSNMVLRDTTAWYHIVLSVDTTQSVASNRVKCWVNGNLITWSTATYPTPQNETSAFADNQTHYIGKHPSASAYWDGYIAEANFVTNVTVDQYSFGEFKSGVWIPKTYSGLYNTNAFYLDMVSSNFSSPTLSDSSGNSNNWTVSGIGSNDFVLDSCTNNYAVMNYWWPYNSANQNVTYSEGNRKYAMGSSNSRGAATMEVLADGCYFEVLFKSNKGSVGVQSIDGSVRYVWNAVNSGELSNIGGTSGATFTDGDIVAIAVGTDGNIKRYLNGSLQASDNTLTGYTAGDPLLPLIGEFDTAGSNTAIVNFGQDSTFAGNKTRQGNTDENGQGDFYYTPPTGFVALCTANMPTPAADPASDVEPRDYFETFLWEGNGGGQQIGDVIKKPADTTTISSSLIFNQPDTAYLSRTPSASTETNSATTFTVSCWFKPTYNPTNFQNIWMAGNSGQVDRTFLRYNSAQDDSKLVVQNDGGFTLTTAQVLRDTSRWYHIVVAVDTRSSVTQADRVKIWVDGVLQTLTGTQAGADETTRWNQNKLHYIGNSTYTSGRNLDGYLAEFHNIDGTAYEASDFGNFDANGIWIPKAVTGVTYGDNGFAFANTFVCGDFVSPTGKTPIGDMTGQGGLAGAFNGNYANTYSASAQGTGDSYIGLDLGSGNEVAVTGAAIYTTQYGILGGGGSTINLNLYGSNTSPSSGTDGTLIASTGDLADLGTTAGTFRVVAGQNTTSYRYIWVYADVDADDPFFAEVEFFAGADNTTADSWNKWEGVMPDGLSSVTVADSPTNNVHVAWNPNDKNASIALSEGNTVAYSATTDDSLRGTFKFPNYGKYWVEFEFITRPNTSFAVGLLSSAANLSIASIDNVEHRYYQASGAFYATASNVAPSTPSAIAQGDIVGMAVNMDDGELSFYLNGALQGGGVAFNDLISSGRDWYVGAGLFTSSAGRIGINSGQRALYGTDGNGTLPTGYVTCTENNITVNDQNLESPDFVWIKNRDNADNHHIYDSVRGVQKAIYPDPNPTLAEQAQPNGLLQFNTNGFTVGSDGAVNRDGQSYVAWCWTAPTSFSNDASATGIGTIDSAGKVNDDLGVSICTFTGTGSDGTFKHGLSQAPDMVIFMRTDTGGNDHLVYHSALGATMNLRFNNSDPARTQSHFLNTEPTSSVFSILGTTFSSGSTRVAYCFAEKEGFSKFGLYHDSYYSDYNADSPFVYLGFKPAWVLIKSTATRDWVIYDNKRTPVNPAYQFLLADTAGTEGSDSTNMDIDFMANGFKIKGGDGRINTTGEDYVFAAFAEMPFKYATAR